MSLSEPRSRSATATSRRRLRSMLYLVIGQGLSSTSRSAPSRRARPPSSTTARKSLAAGGSSKIWDFRFWIGDLREEIMPTTKKRPSKTAKAAAKKLAEAKLLAAKKSGETTASGEEFKTGNIAARTAAANKLRPEKKRG